MTQIEAALVVWKSCVIRGSAMLAMLLSMTDIMMARMEAAAAQ